MKDWLRDARAVWKRSDWGWSVLIASQLALAVLNVAVRPDLIWVLICGAWLFIVAIRWASLSLRIDDLRLNRGYDHWLEHARRVEDLDREIARPLGYRMRASDWPRQYQIYLDGGGRYTLLNDGHDGLRSDAAYNPDSGPRNIAAALHYILGVEPKGELE